MLKLKAGASPEAGSASAETTREVKRRRSPMVGEKLDLNCKETTVEGQMELNPCLSVEQAQAAAKKEYNRRNSARARVRNKALVSTLQEEYTRLTARERELMQENRELQIELERYRKREVLVNYSAQQGLSQFQYFPNGGQGTLTSNALFTMGNGDVSGLSRLSSNSGNWLPPANSLPPLLNGSTQLASSPQNSLVHQTNQARLSSFIVDSNSGFPLSRDTFQVQNPVGLELPERAIAGAALPPSAPPPLPEATDISTKKDFPATESDANSKPSA